ncbi:uncharacterized protein Z518_07127 [Rhinocladiella mackenziei CBS 650.93]|uniref:Rhinocladiella mackenziei CBS 650.93 unplaced genomic scaffold supercont1.5, whole genome shotgun sequence n=1 Tax=Rhinocladiella mackenziei CBS 650.93 TaxID=1442369 RepID=A0A0D2ICK9_9EURO|nr:uncharacterized protein Z518_07127 [Rhinocladiella mackenziei CBS 650.93]KIX03574.1 hypothetical protein Z518_07127 [Rhinocladiella mackenziei CBS 650.93]
MEASTRLENRPEKNSKAIDALEKDETELRLEKALFGDDAGFLDSLKRNEVREDKALIRRERKEYEEEFSDAEDDEEEEEGAKGFNDVADGDLFFVDVGTGDLPPSIVKDLEPSAQQLGFFSREPAWYDSDDDRIRVSLASNTRLRKLRDTKDDDLVTGREYIQRLRRQYERLHPTPEWVTYARKKRKLAHTTNTERENEESDSDVCMDDGEEPLLSAQPLAELLRTSGSLVRTTEQSTKPGSKGVRKLRTEVVDIQRCQDVAGPGPSAIDTLQFHPDYPLLLSAGPSSTITLYHVSPQSPHPNPILTSLHVKGTPLHTVAFCRPRPQHVHREKQNDNETDSHDQTRIFLSSRRRYFHTWSLSTGTVTKVTRALYGPARKEQRTMESFKISPCGRYMGLIGSSKKGGGSINVLSTESMQLVCSCRIDSRGGVADFAWWRDGNGFAVVGKNGEVSEYDIETRRVMARWVDEGAVGTTVIALGGDMGWASRGRSRWVAIGSSSGIVNLYDRRGWIGKTAEDVRVDQRPRPARVLDQLTTPISHLEFSDDGQMLVMSSKWKKNALRLIHFPSCTLYRNWPTDKTPLGRISAVSFSPGGRYLAVANEQGKIRLWEIRE